MTPTIFLSYASQDADVARRICESLRAAGLGVWFDQSELRGGDAWDVLIKKQIKECALFVPVISASTQARKEGYFRREWNMAAIRMLDMAHDNAFLLPVTIDNTSEVNAHVPEKFFEVQWTRLPAGETPQEFITLVRQLLGSVASPSGVQVLSVKEDTAPNKLPVPHANLAEVVAKLPATPANKPNHPPNNIPTALSPIIGRKTELQSLRVLMQEQRLVTLKAMGGIGKTRLALELARETVVHATSETSFPSEVAARHIHSNGIWFVDLAVIADNALVINAVLAELSLKAEADRSALLTLTNAIKGQKLLIVLDNCEQVIEGAAELASSVLRHCPQVYLLCTSREALNVEGETVFALSALSRDEALALFTVRAKAVRTGFAVDASNQAVLEQLVERLDGISLAIELAAARMRNLSLTEIVRLLDDRFAVLTGGSRIALPRQQTLHALIDWSYQLLSEPEKVLFRRLAVFNGDFPLAHAKAICCALPPLAERDALDLISHLVDKSLLLMEDATTASSTCAGNVVEPPPQQYRLLETVGAYALEALKASDNETSLRQAHAKFYATQAEAARKTIPTEAWGQWKERIHKNHSNYRCALEWALAEQNDIPSGTAIATGLGRYWNESGMSPMALQWLELALCHSAALAPLLRGRLVYTLGSTCMNLGRYSQAVTQLRESITLLDCEPEDQAFLGEACTDLAVCLSAIGQLAEATSLFERAAAIAMQAGNDRSYEFALGNLAADLAFQGRFDEADEALARQLKRHGAKMAPEEKVLCMIRRALIAIPRGAAEEARPWLDEALPLIHVLGDHPDALLCLLGALRVQIALDQWAAAAALAQRALDMLRRQPQSRFFPLVAEGVALLMNRQGQSELAARSLGLANRLYVEMSMNRSAMRKTDFDATMESLRSALGEAAVAQHLAEGTALTLEAFFAEAQRFCAAVANK